MRTRYYLPATPPFTPPPFTPECSDLGTDRHHVLAVSAWIRHTVLPKSMGERRLAMLSRRVQLLTAALPDATTVYGLFLTKGPALQGSHYRCANAPPTPNPNPHTHIYMYIYLRPCTHVRALYYCGSWFLCAAFVCTMRAHIPLLSHVCDFFWQRGHPCPGHCCC